MSLPHKASPGSTEQPSPLQQYIPFLSPTNIEVTLELNHSVHPDSEVAEKITFQHTATGGIKGRFLSVDLSYTGTSGEYHFPSKDYKHHDHVFGHVLITAARKPLSQITDPFLKEGWTPRTFKDEGVLWTYTVPDKEQRKDDWSAEQVWGYAIHDIPGKGREERYTRKIHFVSPSLTKDVLLVYDAKDAPVVAAITDTKLSAADDEDLASFGSS
jgi:hypothetical protein